VTYVFLLAVILSTAALFSMRPYILGLFHDDGVYVVVAKSLASGTGHRMISLPAANLQTKYPPVYSYILSVIWRIDPRFPDNVRVLKSVNAVCLFVIIVLSYALFRRHTGRSDISALACVFLVGTNSALVSFADFTLSDNLFPVFALAAVLLHDQDPAGSDTRWRNWGGACAVSLGFLTREVGATLIVAGLVYTFVTRRRRDVIVYVALVTGITLPWLIWRHAAPTVTQPLLTYYTGYATTRAAWFNPRLQWQVVWDNVHYLRESFDVTFLLYALPSLRWVIYPLALLGGYRVLRRRPLFLMLFVLVYVAVVLVYPFAPGRFVVPLVPIVLVCLVAGTLEAETRLVHLAGVTADKGLVVALARLPIALLVVMHVTWYASYFRHSVDDPVRGWYGQQFSYGWRGFTETFDWIKTHTDANDILATPYDPMFFLYTGRRGIRPWFNQPETYFYPRGRIHADVGDPEKIRDSLNEVGARYLVISPVDGYPEAAVASKLFENLLAVYTPAPRLVFVSQDSRHKVYDLTPSRSSTSLGVQPTASHVP
jgi:hypothetical protein